MTTFRYPAEPRSVTEARRMVVGELDELDAEVVEVAALAVSELAANAVRHAATAFTVTVRCTEAEVHVEVLDGGDGRPAVQDPGPLTPGGRGLAIVEQITDGWGVDPLDRGGKRVWFRIALRPPNERRGGAGPTGRSGYLTHGPGTGADRRARWSTAPPGVGTRSGRMVCRTLSTPVSGR